MRRAALAPRVRALRAPLWPLFPLGLPGGYITIAYLASRGLRRRGRHGGGEIVASAWLGWLVHRAVKLVLVRERPPEPGRKRRFDSYPSGHTTGATALALTMARVLRRERVISAPQAIAIACGAPRVMGVYRVIADDHWATDVVGGWVLGGAIAVTVAASSRRARRPRIRRARSRSAA
jgi:undecaprenyl-diphosphatase